MLLIEPEVAVMVAEPFPTAVTTPVDSSTVATKRLLDVHTIAPSVAPVLGAALKVVVAPEEVRVVDNSDEELVMEEIEVNGIVYVMV